MFAQLDTKSVYSFMDSVVDLPCYVKRAKELGYQALGLMDRDNLYAAYHFAQLATKNGLRPYGSKFSLRGKNDCISSLS